MRLGLLSGAYPPDFDAIGHYTACLAETLAEHDEVAVFTSRGEPVPPRPRLTVHRFFDPAKRRSIGRLHEHLAEPLDWLVLEYNPFAFGRWGLNLHLPMILRRLRRSGKIRRLALMVHETFMPVTRWQNAIMTTWQRLQLWLLGRLADVIFFSIEPWPETFRRWFPRTPRLHLPAGANIPCLATPRTTARALAGVEESVIVLGLFGVMHPTRLLEFIRQACLAVGRVGKAYTLLYIGPHGAAVSSALPEIPIMDCGALPEEEVSRRLSAVDVFLTPFADGISTRRGSLMTGLQHGLATAGTEGHLTDAMLRRESGHAFLLSPAQESAAFAHHVVRLATEPELRDRIGAAGQQLFEREFTWHRIAERLRGGLALA